MTYAAVDFMVDGMWCWPPDWDGQEDSFLIFDCAALWFNLDDYRNLQKDCSAVGFNIKFDGDVVTCWSLYDDGKRCVWRLTDNYDLKNNARLMVWPD